MARSIPALVNPDLLKWARESAGFDVEGAAQHIGQPTDRIEAWETGEQQPTMAQLRKVAKVYRRPTAVFYLPIPPKGFSPLKDFRRIPKDVPSSFSPELRFAIRWAREHQEWLVDAKDDLGIEPVGFVGMAKVSQSIPVLARRARELLGLSLKDQYSWSTRDEALRSWSEACESIGIFVCQTSRWSKVDIAEMRGFALIDKVAPLIVINSKDSLSARAFTLVHELAHVLLGEEGISNMILPLRARTPELRTEVFCNKLAAEILVPLDRFRSDIRSIGGADDVDVAIEDLSNRYKVSREVIARRLVDMHLISQPMYDQRRRQYRQDYQNGRERMKAQEIRIPPARFVLRNNGYAFTGLVTNAYADRLINGAELARLLNVKLKHLPAIQEGLSARRSRRGAG